MKCHDIQLQLDALPEAETPQGVEFHLRHCAACRDYAEEAKLRRLLRSMPMREAPAGLDTRLLAAAFADQPVQHHAKSRVGYRQLAMAAAIVLAVLILPWQKIGNGAVQSPAEVAALDLQPVELMLNSGRALEEVTLTVELPAHIALQGYADVSSLQWTASLSAGANKLVLPVQLRPGTDAAALSGEIVVVLEHQGRRKEFRVPVAPSAREAAANQTVITT